MMYKISKEVTNDNVHFNIHYWWNNSQLNLNKDFRSLILLFDCPYTLVMRCGRYLESNPFGGIEFLSRDILYQNTTLRHTQTVGVSDPSCLEHTEQSVIEMVAFRNLPISTWVQFQIHSSDANFLYDQPSQPYQGWLMHIFIHSS